MERMKIFTILAAIALLASPAVAARQALNENASPSVKGGLNSNFKKANENFVETYTALDLKANATSLANRTAFATAWGWNPGDNLGSATAANISSLFSGTGDCLKSDGTKGDCGTGGGVDSWAEIQSLVTGSSGDYVKYDGTRGTPPGTLPTATEGQTYQADENGQAVAVDMAPLTFVGSNISYNEETGLATVPVTPTATSGSATPFTSGGAYTALSGKENADPTIIKVAEIDTQAKFEALVGWPLPSGGTGGYVSLSAAPYSDVACTTGTYGYYGSTAYLCTGGYWTSKWTLTTHSNASPVTYAATLTITDSSATGDTFTLNSIAYDATDSPVSVTDLPTATEQITYTGSNTAACTGNVTGTGPWTINSSPATVGCEITAASFIGAPGTLEGFEGPGITITTEISETDVNNLINCSSVTAAIDGAYGCLFSNGSATALTSYIRADLGVSDESFSVSWKFKTPTASAEYTNCPLFRARSDSTANANGELDTAYIILDNNNTTCKLLLYPYSGSGMSDTSANLSYNTQYNLTLKRTNNTTGGLILEIRDSSNSLVDTITTDATDDLTRYLFWFDGVIGNDMYIDSLQYNSTNP